MRHVFVWLAAVMSVCIFMAAYAVPWAGAGEGKIEVVDMAGRAIAFSDSPRRAVLVESRDIHEFAAVLGDEFTEVIVGWGPDLRAWDKDTYDKYRAKFPSIEQIPEVGFMEEGTFNLEKVISLKPDVVFLALWMYRWLDSAKDAVVKLEQAGIPVVVTDYGLDPIGAPPRSIRLVGKVLNREKRAEEIAGFYEARIEAISSRLKDIKTSRPGVYVECGSKGPDAYGNTYVNHSWDLIIKAAGGGNIAEGNIKSTAPINPEHLLAMNPGLIIITGSYWASVPGAMRLGYNTSPEQAKIFLKKFTSRPGWETLDAVKKNRVYSIFHGYSFRIFNFASLEAFAKWLHPSSFSDTDPEESLREFHVKFLPITYSGTWLIGL